MCCLPSAVVRVSKRMLMAIIRGKNEGMIKAL